jgi:hypothetical protein
MIASAELVLSGIQAAVKLARTARTIYVEQAVQGQLVMPLPPILQSHFADAQAYAFELAGGNHRDQLRYKELFEPYLRDPPNEQAIVEHYFLLIQRGEVPKHQRFYDRERAALTILQQWDDGKAPFPSPIQRVAGTLVNTAVDYFIQVPGAINEDSKYGKTLKAFLQGLDNTDFSEERFDSIIITLFTSSLDALANNPALYSEADDDSDLLRVIVRGIADDLHARLPSLSGPDIFDEEHRLRQFGGLVLRSLLTGTTRSVVVNPTALGLTDATEQALCTNVGAAFLDLLLTGDPPLRQGLQRLASTGGLEKLIHAVLKTAAEHADRFKMGDTKLKDWVTSVVEDLYAVYPEKLTLFNPDLFGNLAYVLIDRGGVELDALLIEKLGAGKGTLLSEVTQQVFAHVVETPTPTEPARWKFQLTQGDLLKLFESIVMALANHPEWLLEKPAHRVMAAETIPFIIEVFTQLGDGGQANLFKAILRSSHLESLLASVLSSGLLDRLRKDDAALWEADKVAASVNKMLQVIIREGYSGLDRVLAPAPFNDLLLALRNSEAIGVLLPEHTAKATNVRRALITEINRMRRGEIVTVPEITNALNQAAAS